MEEGEEEDNRRSMDYQISPLLTDIPLEENEQITAISSYNQINVYIGTNQGRILHYHHFEDVKEYILISQLEISNDLPKHPIDKIICLPNSQRMLILSNRITTFHSLPELSPSHERKMKNINHIEIIDITTKESDSVLVLSPSKIRIVQFQENQIKVAREVNYSGAITGTSYKTSNGGIIVSVANQDNYDILDIDNSRKIPLFGYKNDSEVVVNPCIRAFYAQDSRQEEFLLTISSDSQTSIAMFINTSGDVTRGTLTWVGDGYPNGGVEIDWPYSFGVFNNEKSKLIVSSLNTLETDIIMTLEGFSKSVQIQSRDPISDDKEETGQFKIDHISQVSFQDSSLDPILSWKDIISGDVQPPQCLETSSIILSNGRQVWSIHQRNHILKIQKEFEKSVDENQHEAFSTNNSLANYQGIMKHYMCHLLLLASLACKDQEKTLEYLTLEEGEALIISPELTLFLIGGKEYKYKGIYLGIEKFVEEWKVERDTSLLKLYIQTIQPRYLTSELRNEYYSSCDQEEEVLDFFTGDVNSWNIYDDANKSLIQIIAEKGFQHAVCEVYNILIGKELPDKNDIVHDYSVYLCENLATGNKTLDRAISLLSSGWLSDKDYGKLLVGVLKLDKDRGFAFIRSNKKYLDINRAVMKDLSKDEKGQEQFAILQLELLEASYLRDEGNTALLRELIELTMSTLMSSEVYTKEVQEAFSTLQDQFRQINSLENDRWPKITWPDFVWISGQYKQHKVFLEMYLKSIELCLTKINVLDGIVIPEHDIFNYHRYIMNNDIIEFFNFCDYSNTESVAITGKISIPKKTFYSKDLQPFEDDLDLSEIRSNLIQIFKLYLNVFDSGQSVEPCIKHFVESYSGKYLMPTEVLDLVPDNFPLSYLIKFLGQAIVELQSKSREQIFQKAITRNEGTRLKKLYKEFLSTSI
ncbi:uncharacterized protein J8A68_002614 [[Candida] subhashii]|uniref:CNH domain-containing protein n=1 Tax=[Candida] subhashii TaxID=561895 RepID=A0A8J5QX35_9ASCO|nr:uncharacterized protein J8A68_002614 [[Candida] subhashii]KAG7663865.1 hypothetical protein J8A68_002614 [[Candida] subhashii]